MSSREIPIFRSREIPFISTLCSPRSWLLFTLLLSTSLLVGANAEDQLPRSEDDIVEMYRRRHLTEVRNALSFEVTPCADTGRWDIHYALDTFFTQGLYSSVDGSKVDILVNLEDSAVSPRSNFEQRVRQHLQSNVKHCTWIIDEVHESFSEMLPSKMDHITMMGLSLGSSRSGPPDSMDFRSDINGGVRDQGPFGTCAAFAAATVKAYQEKKDYGFSSVFSPRYIYAFRINVPGAGMHMFDVMNILANEGALEEVEMPYSGMDKFQDETSISEDLKVKARLHAIKNTGRLHEVWPYAVNLDEFKAKFKSGMERFGVGIITVPVWNFGCRMWKKRDGDSGFGGHAMNTVGYNEDGIIIQNSWGEGWCENGYTTMSWEDADKYAWTFYFYEDVPTVLPSKLQRNSVDGECSGFLDTDSGNIFKSSGNDFEACKRYCEDEILCRGVTLGNANHPYWEPHCWFHYATWDECQSVAYRHGVYTSCGNWLGTLESRDNFREYVFDSTQLQTTGYSVWSDQCWTKATIKKQERETITCRMTIDNAVTHVRYAGQDVEVTGTKNEWNSVKTFTLNVVPGAELEIGGEEVSSCNGCQCSGLVLECDNGFTSQTSTFNAVGSSTLVVAPPASRYESVCQSTSGFYLPGQTSSAQKIWAANGKKFAWFKAIPVRVVNQDCIVSIWSTTGTCSKTCGGGVIEQTRTIVTPALGDGADCPNLSQMIDCNPDPCPGTGNYILGQGSQTECPVGSTIVSTPQDCFSTELLDEISAGRGFETDSHFGVRGCFYHPNGNVFFQTTPAAWTNTGYQPVCRSNTQGRRHLTGRLLTV